MKSALETTAQNVNKYRFFWPVFSGVRMESTIISLYGIIRARENPFSSTFYAVNLKVRNPEKRAVTVFRSFQQRPCITLQHVHRHSHKTLTFMKWTIIMNFQLTGNRKVIVKIRQLFITREYCMFWSGQRNTGQEKPLFSHILCSSIFFTKLEQPDTSK